MAPELRGSLHLFFTRTIPRLGPDAELFLFESETNPCAGGPIEPDQLVYATTLVTTYGNLELIPAVINQWWLEYAGAEARVELLTDSPAAMSDDERSRLSELETPGWSINDCFWVYRRDDAGAQREVVRHLRRLSLAPS
jgi:hypothetical protein